jgi:heme-degrading monooxygenase HmoA
MYARVVTSQYQAGKLEEAIQIYRESILPEARKRPGFKGAIGLVDPSTGKAMSIVLWQTEADMRAGETSGSLQAQLAKIVAFLATAPLIETFEVVVQE